MGMYVCVRAYVTSVHVIMCVLYISMRVCDCYIVVREKFVVQNLHV